jgi:hypothetical protein
VARIIGDGQSTVNQLIDIQINSDPRRGAAEEFVLDVIDLADRFPLNAAEAVSEVAEAIRLEYPARRE